MLYEEIQIDSLWQDFYLSEFVVVWSGSALLALPANKSILKVPKMTNVEFANSINQDEMAPNKLPHLNLHC